MKNKIMQLAAAIALGGLLIVASCTSSSSEKTGDQDTTATPVDTTTLNTPVDSTTIQAAPDSSSASK
jgi:hypothetical protein